MSQKNVDKELQASKGAVNDRNSLPRSEPPNWLIHEEGATNVRGSKGRGAVGGARRRKAKGEMI